jgi:hypothetical protein
MAVLLGAIKSKSKYAKKVLQLMDNDFSYNQALMIVLTENPRLSKKRLQKELDLYI